MMAFPFNAPRIGLEWPIEQGGLGVTARTDRAGLPLIGIYRLDPEGLPSQEPVEFAHDQLMLRIAAGWDERHHVISVVLDAMVNRHGLALRIIMPQHMVDRGYDRYLFAPWRDPPLPFDD